MNDEVTIDVISNVPDQPWTIEADMISTVRQISMSDAIDLVILRYLRAGDTRALAWWCYEGHCPSNRILQFLGIMLQPETQVSTVSLPYELIAKSRIPTRGRPKKRPETKLRDWLMYRNIVRYMADNGAGSYESAIANLCELDGVERATVKRAYENMSKIITICQEE